MNCVLILIIFFFILEDSSYDDEDSKNTIHQKISKQLDKQNQKKKIKQTNQIQLFDDIDWLAERRFWRSELAAKRASALDKWIRTAADARQSAGDMFAWSSLMAALCSPRVSIQNLKLYIFNYVFIKSFFFADSSNA